MRVLPTLGPALELAATDHHLLRTADLTALGLDRKQVKALCDDGVLERIVRGLYRIAGTRTPMQDIAAAVSRHAEGVVSGASALWVHDLEVAPPDRPHITLPPGSTSRTSLALLHRSPLAPADVAHRRGVPVTSVARSLVDAAAELGLPALHRVAAEAITSRRATPQRIEEALRRVEAEPGRVGSGVVREVLRAWTGPIAPDSVAEATVLRRIVDHGLPRPTLQHVIRDGSGTFVARVDLAWPDRLVLREYDSDSYHSPERAEADELRRGRLRALGWSVGVIHRGHLVPSREDWLRSLRADLAGAVRRRAS